MTRENTLLTNLSEWRTTAEQKRVVALPESPWTVTLTADRADELSCRLLEVKVQRASAVENQTQADWAARLSASPIPSFDGFKVIETDETRQETLLRSPTPTVRDEKIYYYEVLLRGTTEATLRRYQASHEANHKRQQIPFVLTHETIVNVVESLCR